MKLRRIHLRRRREGRGSWPWPPRERGLARVVAMARHVRYLLSVRHLGETVGPTRTGPARMEVADISDGICAYMVHGLGNQLLLLAAAWQQAERLDCPLYVDNSWYSHPSHEREPELQALDHPGVDITDRSPWAGAELLHGPVGLTSVRSGGQDLQVFTERSFGYDPLINTCLPGTTITGFCQSPMYFDSIATILADRILSADLPPREREYVDAVSRERRTTIHIRRGDYLSSPGHGITENAYFTRAANLYERLNGKTRYRVYSDSPEMLGAALAGFADAEISDPPLPVSPMTILLAMACSDGFIMSNSTFSWWGAWLLRATRPDATVIAPRPWFTDGESASDLLLPDWITLDRRG